MGRRFALLAVAVASAGALAATASAAFQAPDRSVARADTAPACTSPAPVHVYQYYHCYTPQQIRAAYGVDAVGDPSTGTGLLGQGQTIVLVDSYGEPTGAADLQAFHDAFYPNLPNPNFTALYPNGAPDYKNVGNGQSGSSGAEGWAGEAALDIEWAYAIAPLAHIVLIGVPPAETEGVQGFPNLFKAISDAIDAYPSGTVFSMSFGVTEQTFGGATNQPAKFDAVFAKGNAKGDTFFASSGDSGSLGVSKQQRDTRYYGFPTDGWPASSPYVTGGGPSVLYARPSWQQGVLPSAGNHRLVPDLAWNASVNGGVLVYQSFFPSVDRVGWHVVGGTSAASPQVAALTALAVQKAGHGLGNINPLIYSNPGAFTDVLPTHQGLPSVISGELTSNRMFDYNGDGLPVTWDPVPGYPVLGGYDMTTGFGTPKAAAYVAALAG